MYSEGSIIENRIWYFSNIEFIISTNQFSADQNIQIDKLFWCNQLKTKNSRKTVGSYCFYNFFLKTLRQSQLLYFLLYGQSTESFPVSRSGKFIITILSFRVGTSKNTIKSIIEVRMKATTTLYSVTQRCHVQ